jgi:hypothetical protein
MSSFSKSLLERITYHTQTSSTEIGFENLRKMHPSFNESNPIALAYMATNPAIPEEEREILKECFRRVVDAEQRNLQKFLAQREIQTNDVEVNGVVKISEDNIDNGYVCGYKNSDANISVSNY